MKILAALSGGVDSAVAAARLVDAGHEVVGMHLALSSQRRSLREGARGCCSLEDARDAQRVSDVLDIAFYVWNLAEQFSRLVIDDFVEQYSSGHTPNPCVRCNERIKFSAVQRRALDLGFDAICTGHYARLVEAADGPQLHRAVDPAKDQSYVLGVLTQEQLARARFPLGDTCKEDVRAEAASRGLLVADKPDSHDICFVPSGDTAGYLRERLGSRPGAVVGDDGAELGRHDGTYGFTIGQRRGLRLSRPAPNGSPRYVLAVDPVTSTVTVGGHEHLRTTRVLGRDLRWCGPRRSRFDCGVQLRAHGEEHRATAHPNGDHLRLDLHEPTGAVATGQLAVLYDGTRVVGAATVTASSS